jgi:hypothetical protein
MQINLDREIKKFGLDTMYNLDRFQKLILTDREILILISIGLDCQDHQAYIFYIGYLKFYEAKFLEKMAFLKENFETSQNFDKSEVK